MSAQEKLTRLRHLLKGPPLKLVDCYLPHEEAYADIRAALRLEYNRPHMVRAAWLSKLKKIRYGNDREILDAMLNCIRSLKGTESESELNGHEVISTFLAVIPKQYINVTRRRWLDSVYD